MKNFGTLDMTREELSKKFNHDISLELFDYMRKLDWNEKEIVARYKKGYLSALFDISRLELSVEDAWKQAIFEEQREQANLELLNS